jgi:hypothetical protein
MKTFYKEVVPSKRLRWMCAALVSGLLSLLCVDLVEARLEEHIDQGALSLSRSMAEALDGISEHNAAANQSQNRGIHAIRVNGIRLYAQSTHITADQNTINEVFGRFRSGCQTPLLSMKRIDTGQVEEPIMAAPALEGRGETESYAYCIRPQSALTAQGIKETLHRFSTTHDFGALGQFQGMYVRSSGDQHQILVMQLVGELKVEEAFDPNHDVPGQDMGSLPRPSGRRRFSVSHNDAPLINTYQIDGTPETALATYRDQLLHRGISVLTPAGPVSSPTRSLVARTASDTFLVLLHPGKASSFADSRPAALSITRLIQ